MALSCGFYNGPNRTYDAEQISSIFDGIISDGMYSGYKQAMVVIESQNDNEVIIQPGRAWLLHTWAYNDANLPFEAPQSEVVLDRIDALVLDVDTNPEVKNTTFQWVQGTPASQDPERPTLVDTENHKQYPLCYVYRAAGAEHIAQENITNAVGTSEFPFVTGIIDTINTDELLIQWEAQWEDFMANYVSDFSTWSAAQKTAFEAWFETIRGILDEDAAGHLQNEIDALQNEVDGVEELILPIGEATVANNTWTAMQVKNGNNIARLQMNADGDLILFQSVDNGETWEQKEIGEKPNVMYEVNNDQDDWVYLNIDGVFTRWRKAFMRSLVFFTPDRGYNADTFGRIETVNTFDSGAYAVDYFSSSGYHNGLTIEDNDIVFQTGVGGPGNQTGVNTTFNTPNAIDLTRYDKLYMKGFLHSDGDQQYFNQQTIILYIQLVSKSSGEVITIQQSPNRPRNLNVEWNIDISQYSGEYYLRYRMRSTQSGYNGSYLNAKFENIHFS